MANTGRAAHKAARATCASYGSHGDQSSNTSNEGSINTVFAEAPRERFGLWAFGPAAHRREETSHVTAEGRLADVRICVEWSPSTPNAQIVLTCEASCHGKTIQCSDGGWHSRPVEASRRLMRELLATVRLAVEAAVMQSTASNDVCKASLVAATTLSNTSNASAQAGACRGWKGRQCDFDDVNIKCDKGGSLVCAKSNECNEAPGVRVVDIQWASRVRWGGDALYNPSVDGPIFLQGACTLDDFTSRAVRRERPVWVAYNRQEVVHSSRRQTWRDLPRETLLKAVVDELVAFGDVVSTNGWYIDQLVQPGATRTCEDITDLKTSTLETVFGFCSRTALVRIRGYASSAPDDGKPEIT